MLVNQFEKVAVPKSKKLLQFTLDDGKGTDRTIFSGIHEFYEPEEVIVGSHSKVWWKCKKGHEWATAISHRTNEKTVVLIAQGKERLKV